MRPAAPEYLPMHDHEYEKLAAMEDFYWWHVGRKSIIKRQIKKAGFPLEKRGRILNVGCGTGGTVGLLQEFGDVFNVDTSDAAIEFSKNRGIERVMKIDGVQLPFENESFDAVVGLDVLEHIADDKGAIAEWSRVLKKGGVLLVTAPAYQWLWSEHDESLHHYRRYTAGRLANLVDGLTVLKKSYIIVFSFFMIVAYRFLRKIFPGSPQKPKTSYVLLPATLNALLIALLRCEGFFAQWLSFPFGTSILLIAKKT